ncbi:tRNA pseudouridine(38-40) synthase TruA [Gracilibacillus dipsosauri]|uniref:tRNA pseudouridine synthase A n=1 Tax=Gracilibacillus dipsosauri TaxID=178340 RepID=A0A317KV88_9BACI|nr:tRNA pseudouridine(38-40) synthase TruA [Gracilibacillus dipsosauri]PWU67441.1 tRNA pseudouridine(38-40) synthase TruA [Gracilibacillus dipsosauri]
MRLKAIISYDGTYFSGFQIQPKGRTVQGVLESKLAKMHKGKPIRIVASGRTDQGVHAVGQVIHFDSPLQIPEGNWKKALNTMLPDDILVKEVQQVSPDFHARFDVETKEYRYFILQDEEMNLFQRHYEYFVREALDLEAMQQACQYLMGTHDFTSFCAANTNVKGEKVRTITNASFEKTGNRLVFRIRGNGFLYNMVRILVGTLLEIGKGKRTVEDLSTILEAKDRSKAGKTAPPHGLYLWEVNYGNR